MNRTLLKNIYGHPELSLSDLNNICDAHKKTMYKKGDFLLKEGQIANEYLILEKGLIRAFVHDFNGNDITTNFFSENEIVIEVSSLFQRMPTQENVKALTDCVCWNMDFEVFQELYHAIPIFNEWGRAWMAQSLFECKQRSVSMITDSATQRYLQLLKEKLEVIQYAHLKQIASYLGITDSSLSRIRKETAKL
ncbi:Crp/Fnr family transcriptional regulator [Pricia sp.]|uniref:Crp/Fnr family transcriptional regulator n=1 Tax=Pricia sp. TaxID=2268138 RepID=UPI0035937D50